MAKRGLIGVNLGGSVVAAGLVTFDGEVLAQALTRQPGQVNLPQAVTIDQQRLWQACVSRIAGYRSALNQETREVALP